MRLMRPAEMRFLLRRDPVGEQAATQPVITLTDEAAVEGFFDSLAWGGPGRQRPIVVAERVALPVVLLNRCDSTQSMSTSVRIGIWSDRSTSM